ncbi:hypothetical protein RFI_10258 [Reticulomyxa filosa]|uniref:peptidyl-tRNA hydrolase n=1 Tax=Reticulomyxa filosa TaxID=46433 RepID=X6NKR8_RETFI|nr:hypothetical protein RFI_10258 [Reticulomyxa filosa]|eukprot:ETO26875.1 hypothetical protein RFI_10258 [Reticulomyxa filosa]
MSRLPDDEKTFNSELYYDDENYTRDLEDEEYGADGLTVELPDIGNRRCDNDFSQTNSRSDVSPYHHQEKRESAPGPPSPLAQGYLSMNILEKHDQKFKYMGPLPHTPSSPSEDGHEPTTFNFNEVGVSDSAMFVEQMLEMGYSKITNKMKRLQARQALEATGGTSIDLALAWLEGHGSVHDNDENTPFLASSANKDGLNSNDINIGNDSNNNKKAYSNDRCNNNFYDPHSGNNIFNTANLTQPNLDELAKYNSLIDDFHVQHMHKEVKMVSLLFYFLNLLLFGYAIIVRTDLKISTGTIIAQCCQAAMKNILNFNSFQKRIVNELSEKLSYLEKSTTERDQPDTQIITQQISFAKNLTQLFDGWTSNGEKTVILACQSEQKLLSLHVLSFNEQYTLSSLFFIFLRKYILHQNIYYQ